MHKYLRIAFVVGALLATVRAADAAPILLIDGGGILLGATGVDVGGTLYDVMFVDDDCIGAFSGCDNAADFDFGSQAAASVASLALIDQVFVAQFDANPGLTFGCVGNAIQCLAWTPYGLGGLGVLAAVATNTSALDSVSIGTAVIDFDLTSQNQYVWADWSPSPAAAVPEPTSLLLLGSGIAGVAAKLRGRRKRN